MADESQDGSSGNRATVALVDAKVDGLKDLIRAEFANIRDRFEPFATMQGDVAALKAQNADQERRIQAIESGRTRDGEWRRTHLPQIITALCLLAVAIITLVTQLH